MEKLKEQLLEISSSHLSDPNHFVVDVVISSTKGPKKVLILVDGDNGVNIDDCADLSRAIGQEVEEKNLIDSAYRLEVSSPGVDYPLQVDRQFKKNIGRTVKVTTNEGKTIKGEMKAFDENELLLETLKGKGKKKEINEVKIPRSEIKKTIVQISFK